MDVLFENRYERTEQVTREFFRGYIFFRPAPLGVFLLFLAVGIGSLFFDLGSLQIYPPTLCLIYGLLRYYQYQNSWKASVRNDAERGGGEPIAMELTFYEEEFVGKDAAGEDVFVPYGQIEKTMVTRNLIALISRQKKVYVLRKDSFTKGSPEAFVTFLKEAGIKI